MVTETGTTKIKCRLDEDELRERTERLVELLGDRRDKADAAKSSAATYREQLKNLDKDIDGLIDQLTEGVEEREVEVEEIRDERRGEIVTKRVDTGEVIDTRAMTSAERQTTLFDEPEDSDGVLKAGDDDDEPSEPVEAAAPADTVEGPDGQPLVQVPKAKRRRAKKAAAKGAKA